MKINELAGYDLGEYEAQYAARDAILYALAVGASSTQLDLVYERDLRVLPTYACALGLWAVERAGDLGAYDRKRSLHATQTLTIHKPMPREGRIPMRGTVESVLDKGKASVVEIVVTSDIFTAGYSIYLPGVGGWGGSAGADARSSQKNESAGASWTAKYTTSHELAALYRLTGDLHPIHIDPEVAKANGFNRPILHGLCTLGIAARMTAEAAGVHPSELRSISARLSAPVMPGETIVLLARDGENHELAFEANVADRVVLKGGHVTF